ncbi:MAG TPA: cupin domain-containing protein [Candidatus Angelobacter sp.]|nr:cupin domain-containing protein [Candidatus Angelobacter sp.]
MNAKNLTSVDSCILRSNEGKVSSPEPGLVRRIGAFNDKLLLAEHQMEKGWVGARHQHPHEQIVYVVRGKLSVTIGNETFSASPGDSFVVPGGVDHQASALEDSLVIDVFTPCRSDYL